MKRASKTVRLGVTTARISGAMCVTGSLTEHAGEAVTTLARTSVEAHVSRQCAVAQVERSLRAVARFRGWRVEREKSRRGGR